MPVKNELPGKAKLTPATIPINENSSLYKKNMAKFFGEKAEDRLSSRGSEAQRNAAHFFGYNTPAHGERPFAPPTKEELANNARSGPKPVLADKRVL